MVAIFNGGGSVTNKKPSLRERLNLPSIGAWRIKIGLSLIRRGGLIGVILFLAVKSGLPVGFRLDAVVYLIALAWCYLDGATAKGNWGTAMVEAIFLYFLSVQVSHILMTGAALLSSHQAAALIPSNLSWEATR